MINYRKVLGNTEKMFLKWENAAIDQNVHGNSREHLEILKEILSPIEKFLALRKKILK